MRYLACWRTSEGQGFNQLATSVIRYRVVVRDKGVVYDGESLSGANRSYADFVARFKAEADQSMTDSVTLFKNYEVIRQWYRPSSEE